MLVSPKSKFPLHHFISLVKFSHTIFALPFAAVGFTMGALHPLGHVSWLLGLKVLLCMVLARNTAMAFNRLVDAPIDLINPRTAVREIPSGILTQHQVGLFIALNAVGFIVVTYFINTLCFYLSPVALAVVMGYSYTKRFTALCHLILGVGLGLAPVGAYLAVTAQFDVLVIILGLAVTTWVGGFDVIYALQDESFDRKNKLYSIPSMFGGKRALLISRLLHSLSAICLVLVSWGLLKEYNALPYLLIPGLIIFLVMLVYQQIQVKAVDLRKINLAFFTANGIASVTFGILVILSLLWA